MASLLLRDVARTWWDAEEGRHQTLDTVPTWAQFRTAFLREFFPPAQEGLMEERFACLVQGDMSVDQYAAEFTRLSRFSPAISASDTEKA